MALLFYERRGDYLIPNIVLNEPPREMGGLFQNTMLLLVSYHISPDMALIMLATDSLSIFEKANHFIPKSFSDAPM